MPELDRLKEQVAYFKYWQGVMLVTDISIIGWLISSADNASRSTVILAFIGVILLTVAIGILHHRIGHRIDEIGKL